MERHPDEGDALRNKLIRIMKSVGNAGMVASELMFVLCKKSGTSFDMFQVKVLDRETEELRGLRDRQEGRDCSQQTLFQ